MIFLVATVILLLIAINSLYVAAEFSAIGSRKARIARLAEDGNRGARALLPFLANRSMLDRYIAACQVGITISSLLAGYYGQARLTPIVAPLLGGAGLPESAARSLAVVGVLLFLTFLQVVFGELLPKSLALRFPERLAVAVVYPLRWSLTLLRPLIALLNGSALLILRRFGKAGGKEVHVHHPDELEVVFRESAEGGLLDADEREMLSNVFHLRQRLARQIMIPRPRVVAAAVDAEPEQLLRELSDSPYTRFPVYRGTIDEVVGQIELRELWRVVRSDEAASDLEGIVRPLPALPEFLPITEVWAQLRAKGSSLAVVFDEYGSVAGIVRVEDVLEELFGELQDEFDRERELYSEGADGRITVRGDSLISELNERFLLNLPQEGSDTIGGLVMERLQRLPREGDELVVSGVRLQVTEVNGQAAALVAISPGRAEVGEADHDEGGGSS